MSMHFLPPGLRPNQIQACRGRFLQNRSPYRGNYNRLIEENLCDIYLAAPTKHSLARSKKNEDEIKYNDDDEIAEFEEELDDTIEDHEFKNMIPKHFDNTEVGLICGTPMRRAAKHAKQEHANDHQFKELIRQNHEVNKFRLNYPFYERALRIEQHIPPDYHIWGEGVMEQDMATLSPILCH